MYIIAHGKYIVKKDATFSSDRAAERVAAPDNPQKQKIPRAFVRRAIKNQSPEVLPSGLSGAATRIRTGDLILTKDVLYQLSHSSVSQEYFLVTQIIISKKIPFVNMFSRLFLRNFFFYFKLFKKIRILQNFLSNVNILLMIYT